MPRVRVGVKFMLFLSSYIPLFLILAFLARDKFYSIGNVSAPYISIILVVISIASLLFLKLTVQVQTGSTTDFKRVDEYRQRNDQITSYLLVYILPFLGMDLFSFEGAVVFLFIFSIIATIQIRSAQLHVNPTLALFGYDVYQVKFNREISLVVSEGTIENAFIQRENNGSSPATERFLKVAELGPGVYITRTNAN